MCIFHPMKNIITFIICFLPIISFTQKGSVKIIDSQEDGHLVLTAENNSPNAQLIKLVLTTKGYGLSKPKTIEKVVPANTTQEIERLSPDKEEKKSYSVEFSYRVVREETNVNEVSSQKQIGIESKDEQAIQKQIGQESKLEVESEGKGEIIVYSKEGCGRCVAVVNYLKENNIPFQDLNFTKSKEVKDAMTKKLFASGFKGGTFKTPVISIGNEVHYDIKNLNEFLAEIPR